MNTIPSSVSNWPIRVVRGIVSTLLMAAFPVLVWAQVTNPTSFQTPDSRQEVKRIQQMLDAAKVGVNQKAATDPAFTIKNLSDETLLLIQENGRSLLTTHGDGAYDALFVEHSGNGPAIVGQQYGGGPAGLFEIWDTNSHQHALFGFNHGLGAGGSFWSAQGTGVWIFSQGIGEFGAWVGVSNPTNTYPALQAHVVEGSGSAVRAFNDGMGPGGDFFVTDPTNPSHALEGHAHGTGASVFGLKGRTEDGWANEGHAGLFVVDNPNNNYAALAGEAISNGNAVEGYARGTGASVVGIKGPSEEGWANEGSAGLFFINNPGNASTTLVGRTNGWGRAGLFLTTNTASSANALEGHAHGTGASVFGLKGRPEDGWANSGSAGFFAIDNPSNPYSALIAESNSNSASVLHVNQNGTADHIAVFATNGNDWKVVIDRNGDVFADGTFNPGGADLAEAFEVEGLTTAYEPGDVLVISTASDRTVEKSATAYSTLVAGIYATKPGVLLSEGSFDDKVPMGVVGVIPTKVTLEGGPIQRGDLLVTSSTPGHAMKADPAKLGIGMVLGKALENFHGPGTGLIKVLVNVK